VPDDDDDDGVATELDETDADADANPRRFLDKTCLSPHRLFFVLLSLVS